MYILDVIPLVFLPRNQAQIVSYFHDSPLSRGTVVQVLFNNRKIKAVVVSTFDVARRKAVLKKQAMFTLKKIDKVLKKSVSEDQIKKAQELSDYYLVSLGIAMRAVMLHPDEKNYKKYLVTGPMIDIDDVEIKNAKNIKIVDMRKEIRDANYSIFSRHLKEALQTFDRVIIFIPRKGYANFLLCKDCGTGIKCPNCSASLVVHQNLRCHHCGFEQLKPKTCPSCNSYNLKPYGVGIEKVEVELLKFFKYQNLKIPSIVKLTSEIKKIPENWDVLLATQSLFTTRLPPVPFLAIINADTLIHIPDFRAEEILLRQTLLLASMAERTIVQTYNPDDPALVAAATGTVDEFWKKELEQRKQFDYPPFTKLIKLIYRNADNRKAKLVAQNVAEKLGGTPYPALISRERGQYVWNILLKSPPTLNFKPETLNSLRNLPPDWQIDVDPLSVV